MPGKEDLERAARERLEADPEYAAKRKAFLDSIPTLPHPMERFRPYGATYRELKKEPPEPLKLEPGEDAELDTIMTCPTCKLWIGFCRCK